MTETRPEPAGLFVPITTPFRANGDLDTAALCDNISGLLVRGAVGIVVNGSTGEAALLEPAERRIVVESARAVVPEHVWLVAGTGGESTRATIAATKEAERAGADAVMVRAPSYYSPSLNDEALIRHFEAVADAASLPMFLYNMPKYTHITISADVAARLAAHERVIGLKDSSGDIELFSKYRTVAPDLLLFIGSLAHVRAAVDLGAAGGVLAGGCFMAGSVGKLLAAAAARDSATANSLDQLLVPVAREIVGQMGIPGVKYAMDLVGLNGGDPRPPLLPLGEAGRRRVEELVDRKEAEAHHVD